MHKNVSLQLSPVVWIFLRSFGVMLWQMTSQWGSPKLLQGLVSLELNLPFCFFYLFLTWWIMTILSKSCTPDNSHQLLPKTTITTTPKNLALQIFEAFVLILLIANLSLNQTFLTFLLYVRQTWLTKLILPIFLWGVNSCKFLIVLSTKVNLLYLLYSTAQRCCLFNLIKQNCLLKIFLRALILMTQVSL